MNYPSHLVAPRYCSLTHEPMHEGWVVDDGDLYIKNMTDANAHAVSAGYANLEEAYDDEYMYYTEWHDLDEEDWDEVPAEAVIKSLLCDAKALLDTLKNYNSYENPMRSIQQIAEVYEKVFNQYK